MEEFINDLSAEERAKLKGVVDKMLHLSEGEYKDSLTLFIGEGTVRTLVSNNFPRYNLDDMLKLLNVPPSKVYGSKGCESYVTLEWLFSQQVLERPLRVHSNVRYAILKYYVECIERQLL